MKPDLLSELPSQPLPRGRFLYREPDEEGRFGLYGHPSDPRVWISARPLVNPQRAAGPFEPDAGVRALRLANVEIPEGCELGPWQDGLGFFAVAPLPTYPHQWSPIDPAQLEPSITVYGAEDIRDDGDRTCCAPPTYPPRVQWEAPEDLLNSISKPVYLKYPFLAQARIGTLSRTWNAHPARSLVWAPTGKLPGGFYVADADLQGIAGEHGR